MYCILNSFNLMGDINRITFPENRRIYRMSLNEISKYILETEKIIRKTTFIDRFKSVKYDLFKYLIYIELLYYIIVVQ